MRPGDTARVVVGIVFAYGNGTTSNGQWNDMHNLIVLDQFAQQVYDRNFVIDPTVGVASRDAAISSLTVGQNYPNPFGPALGQGSSSVPLSLSKGARITLSIYNELGMELQRQQLGWLTGGEHQLQIDAAGLAPGSYFYEVRAGNESARGRMVVE
jgi:hypothetical protein